jgi:hypothetical protein
MELSTKIPFKFTNQDFHWYVEKKHIDRPQTETMDSTSAPRDKLVKVVPSRPNEPFPTVAVAPSHTIDETLQVRLVDTLTNRLENFVAEKFLTIPQVEYVFLSFEKDSMDIWTVINKFDRQIRAKIYDVEYDILDIIKGFEFDFHVICRNNRSIQELYPSNTRIIFKK